MEMDTSKFKEEFLSIEQELAQGNLAPEVFKEKTKRHAFLAPIIASWGAVNDPFGFGWRVLYPIYLGVGILATLLLFGTKPPSDSPQRREKTISRQFADSFALLLPSRHSPKGGAGGGFIHTLPSSACSLPSL